MLLAIFIAICLIMMGIVLRYMDETPFLDIIIIAFGIIIFFIGIFIIDTPSAMDVYQGKTTLEITYKDGVAVDSVVVYKDKEK